MSAFSPPSVHLNTDPFNSDVEDVHEVAPVGSLSMRSIPSRSSPPHSKSRSTLVKTKEERGQSAKQGSVSKGKGKARAHSVPADEEEPANVTPDEM